jgi:hypothetical protein
MSLMEPAAARGNLEIRHRLPHAAKLSRYRSRKVIDVAPVLQALRQLHIAHLDGQHPSRSAAHIDGHVPSVNRP